MKYKFLKSIVIGPHEYKMIYDPKAADGEFSYPYKKEKGFIRIGMRDVKGDSNDFLHILIHEVMEIIHCELGTRFKALDNHTNYLFNYHHKDHTAACGMLAGILKQFIK